MERPFDYPGSHSETPFTLATFLGQFMVEAEDGESYTRYSTYDFHSLADADEIGEYIKDNHPATRCQHEHDCCGRFYGSTAHWDYARGLDKYTSGETVTVVVKQSFHCNI